jgi:type 1 glutamine amidotransferase
MVLGVAFDLRAAEEKLKALIVTGSDVASHPWRESTPFTVKKLEETGRFEVKVVEDVKALESAMLDQYDLVVLNFGHWTTPELSESGRKNLLNYVENGGGLMSLHFACSAFQEWPEYATLLGRVWKRGVGGHGPRGKFNVNVVAKDHPITKGASDFEADDELYAKLTGDAEIRVLASAHSDWSGKVEPIVFVKKYGKGNVVHNLLGHDMRARENPHYIELLQRGAEWAATGKVSQGD